MVADQPLQMVLGLEDNKKGAELNIESRGLNAQMRSRKVTLGIRPNNFLRVSLRPGVFAFKPRASLFFAPN